MRISPINLLILAYTLDVEGFDAGTVLRQCGIQSADELQEDGEWVPVELFDRMMAAVIEVTGDSAFGLVSGKSIALMRYGVLTPLVLSAPNLRQILDDIRRFAPLVLERSELELVEERQTAHLFVHPVVHGGASAYFRMEQVATSAVQMLRFAGVSNADIYQADFPYPVPPQHAQRYLNTFGARTRFGQKHCVISFKAAGLDTALPTHDPVAYLSSRSRADSILAAAKAGSDLVDTVRQSLLRTFPRLPTVSETAACLSMSERSFRRQLGMLGTTHAQLIQECQCLMAERLLADGKQPLKQIAEALGFSSVHSFHRAFRRWRGLTPSVWRESRGSKAAQ